MVVDVGSNDISSYNDIFSDLKYVLMTSGLVVIDFSTAASSLFI